MLFQVGPLTISRRPFHVEEWTRTTTASIAEKDLLGAESTSETTGLGKRELSLSGSLHPFARSGRFYGGLSSLELAHSLARSGAVVLVTRGDGRVFGFYKIKSVEEKHSELGPHTGGVGQVIEHELELAPANIPGTGPAADMLSNLISLLG